MEQQQTRQPLPPRYILLSQTSLPSASSGSGQGSGSPPSTLVFPTIHYHYADDSPLSLLPPPNASPYLIMDWDPSAPPGESVVRSISEAVTVVGMKVSPAPGVSDTVDHESYTNMFVIETMTNRGSALPMSPTPRTNPPQPLNIPDGASIPASALMRFKQRNVHLREAFEHNHIALPHSPQRDDQNEMATAVADEAVRLPSLTSSPQTMKNVPLGP